MRSAFGRGCALSQNDLPCDPRLHQAPLRMTLPERFHDATFESYEPQMPSQAKALRVAQGFVAEQQRVPSWTEWIQRLFGATSEDQPQGLCLVGPAGTGKTHLLAATVNALAPEVPCAFLHSSMLFRQTEPPDAFAHRFPSSCAVPGPGGRTGRSAPLLSPHLPTPTLPYANTLTRQYAIPRSAPRPDSLQSPRPAVQSRPAPRSESPRTR